MTAADEEARTAEDAAVAKRRLRNALKRARGRAKMTQKAAADELVWSVSKIVRIELGSVPVTPTDAKVMLQLYGEPPSEIDRLVEVAKVAREGRGADEADAHLSEATRELIAHEPVASAICKYEPAVIPGLLQTRDYSRALMRALGKSEAEVEAMLEVRARRQRMLESATRPEIYFILGQAAVMRVAGGTDVMREQMNHLLETAARHDGPGFNLLLLPFSAGVHRAMGSAFTILEFDEEELPDLLYLENAERDSMSHDEQHEIKNFKNMFADLQKMAADAGDFADVLRAIAEPLYGPLRTP